jgi:hypothetical protein
LIPCPFYEHHHEAETWDAIDEASMACRDRQRAEGGDLPVEEQPTKSTEMGIADAATLVMPCLFCGAVTVLEGGICVKCAEEGRSRFVLSRTQGGTALPWCGVRT